MQAAMRQYSGTHHVLAVPRRKCRRYDPDPIGTNQCRAWLAPCERFILELTAELDKVAAKALPDKK